MPPGSRKIPPGSSTMMLKLPVEETKTITAVSTLERASDLDTQRNSLFLSKDGELLVGCKNV